MLRKDRCHDRGDDNHHHDNSNQNPVQLLNLVGGWHIHPSTGIFKNNNEQLSRSDGLGNGAAKLSVAGYATIITLTTN